MFSNCYMCVVNFQVSNYVASQQCKARNLIVGKTYLFHVMAENKYGVSDPAIITDPITARYPFGILKIIMILISIKMMIFF